ncbi:MAG: DUF3854 domain-containing protein [Symploca sp. SIO1C4]|uniref:DUF3854 domain-containing protein n=1 Tax=Symploca sp. SIO1C4 TaxID=2607765 RepID=A0A6B3NFC5_9CYAN|nr:DUF3854 domain-containing protein [Symploca sp. SIO1C4]
MITPSASSNKSQILNPQSLQENSGVSEFLQPITDAKSTNYGSRPSWIWEHHWREWTEGSAISPELTARNLSSIEGTRVYEELSYSAQCKRKNTGVLTNYYLKKFSYIAKYGGWYVPGRREGLWGCFKPDRPRLVKDEKGKTTRPKYEHPIGVPTESFQLRLSWEEGRKIAQRYGKEDEYARRIPAVCDIDSFDWKQEDEGFWDWVQQQKDIPLFLTEGAKKAAALLSQGYCAIAIPGVYNFSFDPDKDDPEKKNSRRKRRRIIPSVEPFCIEGREINMCFDKDEKPKTFKNVAKQLKSIGFLLKRKGCNVKFVEWESHLGKGVDDLIVNNGAEALHKAVEEAISFEYWQAKLLSRLTRKANQALDQRYLGELQIPPSVPVIAIKSAKGTGKTESLIPIVKRAVEEGRPVLLLGHRIQLVKDICRRVGLNYITDVRMTKEGMLNGFGLVVNSLHPESQAQFNAEDWEDAVVIIDEAEQVIWHMLSSNTCKGHRIAIFKEFDALIRNASQVYLADADLSDLSVDFICGLKGGVTPYVILNSYRNEDSAYRYQQLNKPEEALAQAIAEYEAGGKVFIACSGQKPGSKFGTGTIAKVFQEKFPGAKIGVVDSETVADPSRPEHGCITRLNDMASKCDILIASPVIETGVSIDINGHFTCVIGIFTGVQAENAVRQVLSRIREPIPRYIYVAKRGLNLVGNGAITPESIAAGNDQAFKTTIRILERETASKEILGDISSLLESSTEYAAFLKVYKYMAARHNCGKAYYEESVFAGLKAEGHMEFASSSPLPGEKSTLCTGGHVAAKAAAEDARDENYEQYLQDVCEAEPFGSEDEYKKSIEKREKTNKERYRERHHEIVKRYGRIHPELVKIDDARGHQMLLSHYRLYKKRYKGGIYTAEAEKLLRTMDDGKGFAFPPDVVRSQKITKHEILVHLGADKLFANRSRKFSASDPDVIEFAKKVKQIGPWALKTLGLPYFKDTLTPMQIVKKVAREVLGFDLERVGREGSKNASGKRDYIYAPLELGWREDMYEDWYQKELERAEARRAAKEQREMQQRDQAAAMQSSATTSEPSTNSIYKNITNMESVDETETPAKAQEVISKIENTPPESLRQVVQGFVRMDWWREVADWVWVSVGIFARGLIDEFDLEALEGW